LNHYHQLQTMSEKIAERIVLAILSIITALCLPAFLLVSFSEQADYGAIFVIINMAFFWKFYLGMKKYYTLVESQKIESDGYKMLELALFRFF
jgi:hypothetical protein